MSGRGDYEAFLNDIVTTVGRATREIHPCEITAVFMVLLMQRLPLDALVGNEQRKLRDAMFQLHDLTTAIDRRRGVGE
jgi:hypothetical protein